MTGQLKLFMAPMAGITNRVFRALVREFGADYTCTEMVSVQGLIHGNRKTFSLLDLQNKEDAGIQLFGRTPGDFIKAFQIIEMKIKSQFIDINMGCPVPKIVKGGMGAALLREPRLAEKIVKTLVREVNVPVSVKIRLGWNPEEKTGGEVALRCQDAGASWITVHGRTRDQFYSGNADWNEIAAIQEKLEIPVVANGDVFSARDALALSQKTACRMIMVGRGALGNPWIFRQIRTLENGEKTSIPGKEEIMEVLKKHINGLICLRGSEKRAVREMRKHLGWYIKGLPGAREVRKDLVRIEKARDVQELLAAFLSKSEKGKNEAEDQT